MSIFTIIFLTIPLLSLLWWAWGHRRLQRLGMHKGWHVALAMGMAVILGGFLWVILARQGTVQTSVPPHLYAVVLIWGLLFLPFVAFPIMTGWALWKIGKGLKKSTGHPLARPPQDVEPLEQANLSRRQLLGAIAVILPMAATFGSAILSMRNITHFRIRKMTVTLSDLPSTLDGMTIAHLTDTHVGKFTRGHVLNQLAKATEELNADLVLFTGDLIDNSIKDLPAALEMMEHIDRNSRLFMIEGNHDLIDDGPKFRETVKASGIPLLLDESVTIAVKGVPVQLMGIMWDREEAPMRKRINHVASMRQPGTFPILLAHHPHAFDHAAALGLPLVLAGHTHGGQLMVTDHIGAGPMMFRYWSGLYRRGKSAMVVSNGAGNWFPIRTHAPAEIIHLTLRKEV